MGDAGRSGPAWRGTSPARAAMPARHPRAPARSPGPRTGRSPAGDAAQSLRLCSATVRPNRMSAPPQALASPASVSGMASSLSTRRPSISTTSKRQPPKWKLSPSVGSRLNSASAKPAAVA